MNILISTTSSLGICRVVPYVPKRRSNTFPEKRDQCPIFVAHELTQIIYRTQTCSVLEWAN